MKALEEEMERKGQDRKLPVEQEVE